MNEGEVEAPPHLVMVVGNTVLGDSRVQKSATTAQRAGYRVTVVGLAARTVDDVDIVGGIPVLRVRPDYALHNFWERRHDTGAHDLTPMSQPAGSVWAHLQEKHRLSRRNRDLWSAGRATSPGLHARLRSLHARLGTAIDARAGAWLVTAEHSDTVSRLRSGVAEKFTRAVPGAWRYTMPLISDLEDSFSDLLLRLDPDLVHVHDRHAMAAAELVKWTHGTRPVPWVYDAHEYLPTQVFPGPGLHAAAWRAAERTYAPRADAVITVSDEIAGLLQVRHALPERPPTVSNAPSRVRRPAPGRRTVRAESGLEPDVPLLVYVGHIAEKRGVQTLVQALEHLPSAHLAVVCPPGDLRRTVLTGQADALGVAARLHIHDYVDADSVSWYLADATVGMSPLADIPAHQRSMGTKIREYLHAGLPVVGSRVRTLAAFLDTTGCGATHTAGDPVACADAVTRVLDDLERFRAAITPEMLDEHSWERQEKTLETVWGELVPAPPRPEPGTDAGHVVIGPLTGPAELVDLCRAVAAAHPGRVDLVTHEEPTSPAVHRTRSRGTDRLNADALDDLRHHVVPADAVLVTGFHCLLPGVFQTLGDEVRMLLRSGKTVSVIVPETDVADLDDLRAHGTFVPSAHAGGDGADRWNRRVRRNRRTLQRLEVPVLVLGTGVPVDLARMVPVPVPVPSVDVDPVRADGPLLLGSLHRQAALAPEVDAAVARVVSTRGARVAGDDDRPDVVVVPGRDIRGPEVLRTIARGSVVVAALNEGTVLPDGPPVETVTPAGLDSWLDAVAATPRSLAEAAAAQRDWVRHHHSPRLGVEAVTGSLRGDGVTRTP